ncbi:MAG: hypothetical protein WBM65_09850 [Sedimenticolaceae bacterium]
MNEETTNEETTNEVRLLDFDTLKLMLDKKEIESLIGYTKDGQMLVAADKVSDLTMVKDKYQPPESDNVMFAYSGACCAHTRRHWPIWSRFGLVCHDLNAPCKPGEPECGPCIHTHG